MKRRPFVGFTVCWLAGSIVAHLYDGTQMAMVLVGLALLLFAAGRLAGLPGKTLLLFGLALGLAASYGTYRDARNFSVLPDMLGETVEGGYSGIQLEGMMAGAVKIDGDLAMFEMSVEGVRSGIAEDENDAAVVIGGEAASKGFVLLPRTEKVVVRVKLAAEDEQKIAASWGRGDRVAVSADLETPSEARNFGAFDYLDYLRDKRIHWVARAAGASSLELLEPSHGGLRLLRRNDDLRALLAGKLEQLYPGIGAGYMQGLLLGLQDGLDPETYTNFARLGMTHVLAISGMHVGLYVGAVLLILRRSGVAKETSLVAALCFVPPYVLLTGSSPSAIRAGIMSMIGLYAARRGWLKDGLHILCLAALLMLVWDPYYLTSISFQLSFAVTAGIIMLTRPMRQILFFLPDKIATGASISLVADLVSFPLSIYYFNQYSLLGLAANLILVPLISLISIPLGTISLILGTFWMQGAEWTAYPVRLLNAIVFWCADGGGAVRWARTLWASPSPGWIALYLSVLFAGIFGLERYVKARALSRAADQGEEIEDRVDASELATSIEENGDTRPLTSKSFASSVRYGGMPDNRRNRMRPWLVALCVCLLAGLLTAAYRPKTDPAGLVQMLDVGQGDAILITTPSGKHLLVDGGGTITFERPGEEWRRRLDPYEVGRDVVVPLLKKRGVHRLDAVILTHGDRDHYGGLLAVIDEIPVERFIMNGTRSGREDLDELLAAAMLAGSDVYAPQDGDAWSPDERTTLEFLNPSGVFAGNLPELEDQNEYSVAFRMVMNGHSFVFTGDIGGPAERDILKRLAERGDKGTAEVLKVGHHGSKHSSTEDWVKHWSPELSIISVGASNTYGHPNEDVVDRLKKAGSLVRRTDLDGEIQIEAPSGVPIRVRTLLGDVDGTQP